jgi:peptide/nickel transport system permease protein
MADRLNSLWKSLTVGSRIAVTLLLLVIILGLLAPLYCGVGKLVPFGPNQSLEYAEYLAPLSLDPAGQLHLFGTDGFGRDVLVRLLYGVRTAVVVGLGVVIISLIIAVLVGITAGYFGNRRVRANWMQVLIVGLIILLAIFYFSYGFPITAILIVAVAAGVIVLLARAPFKGFYLPLDTMILKVIEVVKTIPALFLVLSLFAIFSQGSMMSLVIILGLLSWPSKARLLRAEVLKAKESTYIVSSQILGLSEWRTIVHHLLPNVMAPLIVASCFTFTGAIIAESTLSFLNVGLPQDIPSWGGMMREARDYFNAWWLAVFPGLALFLTILGLNVIADQLNNRENL